MPSETDEINVIASATDGTIRINGVLLEDNQSSRIINLNYGNTTITVVWTDGTNTETYTAEVFRVYDLDLQNLSVAWGGFSGSEDNPRQGSSEDPSYEPAPRIPNNITTASVTVKLNVGDIGVNTEISLNSKPVTVSTSTEAGLIIAKTTVSGLVVGENIINIRVLPPTGGGEPANYVIKLNRRYNTQLVGLRLAKTRLINTLFSPLVTEEHEIYIGRVSNAASTDTITLTRNPGTTVFIDDEPVRFVGNSLNAKTTINYPRVGTNSFRIHVTAPDEVDTGYRFSISRGFNLRVRDLTVSYSDMNDILVSTTVTGSVATVPAESGYATIEFSTDLDIEIELEVNDKTTTATSVDRVTTAAVPLNFDENLIKIKTSTIGQENVTTFTIIRLRGSNPNLKQPNGLSVSEGTIDYDETNRIYRVNVENNVESLRMTLMPQDANVMEIALNGTSLALGSLKQTGEVSTVITDLMVGNNTKTLMITAHNGEVTQSYTLIVNRAVSTNDRLSGFEFSLFAGESNERIVRPQRFNPETLMYTLPDVEEEINRIKATLVSSDNDAKIEVRKSGGSYSAIVRGMQSDFINLSLGENVIEIKVTASDEITSRVYTVKMRRRLSTNTDLSEAPRVESNLASRVAGSDNYVIAIDADTTHFTVAATAAHSSATVMISGGGGSDVRGSPSATKENISISREIAPVTITIVVLSQSNRNRQTYNLRINLALSSETRLASLTAGANATALTVVENQTAYTASIGEEISETTVTAVARDRPGIGENYGGWCIHSSHRKCEQANYHR